MLELTPLRYFLSAYETGTFSQAARVNGVSQPTVSAANPKVGKPLRRTFISTIQVWFDGHSFWASNCIVRLQAVSLSSRAIEGRIKRKPRQSVRILLLPRHLTRAFCTNDAKRWPQSRKSGIQLYRLARRQRPFLMSQKTAFRRAMGFYRF